MPNPTITTAPVHLPVTMREAKEHLRIEQDYTDWDADIWMKIQAATEAAEVETNRKLVTQTLTAYFDDFPAGDFFKLEGGTLQSIDSLTYTDSDDSDTVWTATNYFADTASEPGRLHLAYGISWPSVTLKPKNAIAIQYDVGYGTADQVPHMIHAAILLTLGSLWENREDQLTGQGIVTLQLPQGARSLLHPYKLHVF